MGDAGSHRRRQRTLGAVLPNLVLDTRTGPLALAAAFVSIVVQLWARTTNHPPRADRGGRSRVDLYAEQPSDEQIAQARCELQETVERLERARLTRQARCRPGVLDLLDSHFARLGLLDPQRSVRIAIAGHSLHAILAGISIFDAKLTAKTLPDGVDARYRLGIVKNVDAQTEGEAFARSLYDLRIELRDRMLAAWSPTGTPLSPTATSLVRGVLRVHGRSVLGRLL